MFNAYQQTQTERVEGAMSRARYVASFIGREAGKALFIGLYAVGKSKPITRERVLADSCLHRDEGTRHERAP